MKYLIVFCVFLLLLVPSYVSALNIGIGSYINSAGVDANQVSLADLLGETGSNWTRMEIPYDLNYDFSIIDRALQKTSDKGVKVLLLFAHSQGLTASQFESWVDTVVNRVKDKVDGYEIFNEIDNTLSASAYKPFLEKAHGKIKAIDPSATVVSSGLTGRKEAIEYWNALYDAGGGSFFDVLGIHPYRTSSPETKEFNNGSMVDSINQAVVSINAHGGGKKVWITEFGWQSGSVGESSQGNLLARGYLLSASVPEVDNIIGYRLADNDVNTTFGVAKSDFTKKASFGSVQTVVGKIKGSSFSERVDAVSKKTIDNFDGLSGWKDDGSSGGSVSLSSATGRSGGGMKYSWSFSGNLSYVVAKNQVTLEGEPKGLALWINGDNQGSVWKLRVEDKNGETFQFDLGQAPSGWKQYTFDFANDKAKTSWGGNGVMDYPIKFDSLVLDNQGGSSSGSVTVDDVEAWYGETDLYALRFGSLLAYWKSSGSATATVCGQELSFTTAPKYTTASASACAGGGSANGATTPSSPAASLDSEKSELFFDKTSATADGKDTILVKIYLKDTSGGVFKSSQAKFTVSGTGNTVSKIAFKDNDHYEITIKSTKAEEKEVKALVGKTLVKSGKVTFIGVGEQPPPPPPPPAPVPAPTPEPVQAPVVETTPAPPPPEPKKALPVEAVAAGGGAAALGLGLAAWKFGWLEVLRRLLFNR